MVNENIFKDEDIQKMKKDNLDFNTINANNMVLTVHMFCKSFYEEGKPYMIDLSNHPKYNKDKGHAYITALLKQFTPYTLSFITATGKIIELTARDAVKFKVIVGKYVLQ